MVKLEMLLGKLLCVLDQITFSFSSEYVSRKVIVAPRDGKFWESRSLLSGKTASSNSFLLR